MHNDKTGLGVLRKTCWLHTASTPEYAYFVVTLGRSFENIKSVGLLEGYKGRTIHDFLPAYLKFEDPAHGLCNAHHLRELTYVEEELGQGWAGDMSALLPEAKGLKDNEAAGGKKVGPGSVRKILGEYRGILATGLAIDPVPGRVPGRRGRPKGKPSTCSSASRPTKGR